VGEAVESQEQAPEEMVDQVVPPPEDKEQMDHQAHNQPATVKGVNLVMQEVVMVTQFLVIMVRARAEAVMLEAEVAAEIPVVPVAEVVTVLLTPLSETQKMVKVKLLQETHLILVDIVRILTLLAKLKVRVP
jgi:hypothetical protein